MGRIEKTLRANGWRVRLTHDFSAPEKIVVCWGWGKAKEVRARNPEAIILCLDHGYTWQRKNFINTGWSSPDQPYGLNGWAEHAIVDDGGARSRAKGWWGELKPVKQTGGKNALLLGQVYGDAMIVDHVEDYTDWLHARREELERAGYRVTFRPHPQMVLRGNVSRYGNCGRPSPHKDLFDDLRFTDRAVAMNSNALVQAYTEGVPEVVGYNKGSMLWPLIGIPGLSATTDQAVREKWWARMAWTQWDYDELEGGLWYEHHRSILLQLVQGRSSRPWWDTVEDYG